MKKFQKLKFRKKKKLFKVARITMFFENFQKYFKKRFEKKETREKYKKKTNNFKIKLSGSLSLFVILK